MASINIEKLAFASLNIDFCQLKFDLWQVGEGTNDVELVIKCVLWWQQELAHDPTFMPHSLDAGLHCHSIQQRFHCKLFTATKFTEVPLLAKLRDVPLFALRRSTLDFCLGGQRPWRAAQRVERQRELLALSLGCGCVKSLRSYVTGLYPQNVGLARLLFRSNFTPP